MDVASITRKRQRPLVATLAGWFEFTVTGNGEDEPAEPGATDLLKLGQPLGAVSLRNARLEG